MYPTKQAPSERTSDCEIVGETGPTVTQPDRPAVRSVGVSTEEPVGAPVPIPVDVPVRESKNVPVVSEEKSVGGADKSGRKVIGKPASPVSFEFTR